MEKMQARDIDKALDGFTRAVQLDPENGEAWNNIACLYVFLTFCSSTSFFLQSFSILSHSQIYVYFVAYALYI